MVAQRPSIKDEGLAPTESDLVWYSGNFKLVLVLEKETAGSVKFENATVVG